MNCRNRGMENADGKNPIGIQVNGDTDVDNGTR